MIAPPDRDLLVGCPRSRGRLPAKTPRVRTDLRRFGAHLFLTTCSVDLVARVNAGALGDGYFDQYPLLERCAPCPRSTGFPGLAPQGLPGIWGHDQPTRSPPLAVGGNITFGRR